MLCKSSYKYAVGNLERSQDLLRSRFVEIYTKAIVHDSSRDFWKYVKLCKTKKQSSAP